MSMVIWYECRFVNLRNIDKIFHRGIHRERLYMCDMSFTHIRIYITFNSKSKDNKFMGLFSYGV